MHANVCYVCSKLHLLFATLPRNSLLTPTYLPYKIIDLSTYWPVYYLPIHHR